MSQKRIRSTSLKKSGLPELGVAHLDIPSSRYHGLEGSWSSSQLKDILDDPEKFFRKYIAKTEPRAHISAFDFGNYFHTAILEPHKVEEECAIFPGYRRGEKWERFSKRHEGKAIITQKEKEKADHLIKVALRSRILQKLLKKGDPEISVFVPLRVLLGEEVGKGDVYCPLNQSILTVNGWKRVKHIPKEGREGCSEFVLKARADWLTVDNRILDLKTTSGDAKSAGQMKYTVKKHKYDLSAALYLDLFSAVSGSTISDFIWAFASKDEKNFKCWRASNASIMAGRVKWKKALVKIAWAQEADWIFREVLEDLGPTLEDADSIKDFNNV